MYELLGAYGSHLRWRERINKIEDSMKGRETMATFTLDNWDYDDTSPDKYILNGWTGSTTEKEIYIPGGV